MGRPKKWTPERVAAALDAIERKGLAVAADALGIELRTLQRIAYHHRPPDPPRAQLFAIWTTPDHPIPVEAPTRPPMLPSAPAPGGLL